MFYRDRKISVVATYNLFFYNSKGSIACTDRATDATAFDISVVKH